MAVTSPPYWGLRAYGTDPQVWGGDPDCQHEFGEIVVSNPNGAGGPSAKQKSNEGSWHVDYHDRTKKSGLCRCGAWLGELGSEPTIKQFVANIVEVFGEVWRVLRDDGLLFLNIGDSYAAQRGGTTPPAETVAGGVNGHGDADAHRGRMDGYNPSRNASAIGLKHKDLCLVPERLLLALQDAGWYVRDKIVWCLSGGTWLYVRTQKGDMPMTVKDLARLDPATVSLWNGTKWTKLLGMSKSQRTGQELELVLRSGERISCTGTHRFPTNRGVIQADQIKVGDRLVRTRLPQPESVKDCVLDEDAAWFAGLYLAEGSRHDGKISIAGHSRETDRWQRCERIAKKFGGSASMRIDGNNMTIRVFGKILNAIIDEFVSGKTAKDKAFSPSVWRYSDRLIESMMDGYLHGDGHDDHANGRIRLGFTRNYSLERDLRTACARLGWTITLRLSTIRYDGRQVQAFRGEIRKTRSGHQSEKSREEVIEVRKARCRNVYDLGVADEPHLFALASGILTHNSKPAPMPESVRDRCTKAWEPVFMLAKSPVYFADMEAVREAQSEGTYERFGNGAAPRKTTAKAIASEAGVMLANSDYKDRCPEAIIGSRNLRNVWTISTEPLSLPHFAAYPTELPARCIKIGTSEKGVCPACGAPWVRTTTRKQIKRKRPNEYTKYREVNGQPNQTMAGVSVETTGWEPTCACHLPPIPATVLDPFLGSGSTSVAAERLGRSSIGCELNEKYAREIALYRIQTALDTGEHKATTPISGQRELF